MIDPDPSEGTRLHMQGPKVPPVGRTIVKGGEVMNESECGFVYFEMH